MHKLARRVVRTSVALGLGLAAVSAASAAELAIVVVPQGMILETRIARTPSAGAPAGTPIELVVARDMRVGAYVVISAGAQGAAHLVRTRCRGAATAPCVAYDYVIASDGTRIPVTGSLPYLTTSASRTVVVYGVAAADPQIRVTATTAARLR